MDHDSTGTTEAVAFTSKQKSQHDPHLVDEAGHAVIAMLQEAAKISAEKVERAMTMAHKISMELRAAEDRVNQLEAEIEHLRQRAARAERWHCGRRRDGESLTSSARTSP